PGVAPRAVASVVVLAGPTLSPNRFTVSVPVPRAILSFAVLGDARLSWLAARSLPAPVLMVSANLLPTRKSFSGVPVMVMALVAPPVAVLTRSAVILSAPLVWALASNTEAVVGPTKLTAPVPVPLILMIPAAVTFCPTDTQSIGPTAVTIGLVLLS